MSLNTIRALLILNAKKGWSDVARKKAALTRKAKAKGKSETSPSKSAAGKSPSSQELFKKIKLFQLSRQNCLVKEKIKRLRPWVKKSKALPQLAIKL